MVSIGFFGRAWLADFNGDGIPDLVGTVGRDVVLVFGDGNGKFGPPTTIAVSIPGPVRGPTALVLADFNGDGKPDVAVSYFANPEAGGGVAVLLGDGQGGFGTPSFYLLNHRIYALAVADFNGDGKPDLAAVEDGFYDILPGDGMGFFGAPVPTSGGGAEGVRLYVGDFNEDGKKDLVVVDGGITIYPGDGTGHFGAPLMISLPPLAAGEGARARRLQQRRPSRLRSDARRSR